MAGVVRHKFKRQPSRLDKALGYKLTRSRDKGEVKMERIENEERSNREGMPVCLNINPVDVTNSFYLFFLSYIKVCTILFNKI